MPDTHINAYFADVDAAAEKVRLANDEWREAKLRLEAKKKEIGWQEPKKDKPQSPDESESTKPSVFNRHKK